MSIPKVLKDHSTMIVAILGVLASFVIYTYTTGFEVTTLKRDQQQAMREMTKIDDRVKHLETREYYFAIWQAQVIEQLKTINEKLDKLGQSK